MKQRAVQIFISYAHLDPPYFRNALVNLLHWPNVTVSVWTDEQVLPGSVPDQQIRAALGAMHVFVPLITPCFDASSYIQEVEVPIAKRRHKNGEILVAPVVVDHPGGRNSRWLLDLERLPHKQKSWAEIRLESIGTAGCDLALRCLRDGIKQLVDQAREVRSELHHRVKLGH